MSQTGSTASSVKRHVSSSLSQWTEHTDVPSEMSQHSLSSHHHHHRSYDNEWDAKEELRLRELEEARARAAQMEKTMRWWSDCTANWREKWSKVRTERNKAREESRVLRGKLEAAAKECNTLKREKQELFAQVEKLKKENQSNKQDYTDEKKEVFSPGSQIPERDVGPGEKAVKLDELIITLPSKQFDIEEKSISSASVDLSGITQTNQDLQFLEKLLHGDCNDSRTLNSPINEKKCSRLSVNDFTMPELTEQKLAMLTLRLDEASKTIIAERQEKNKLMKSIEKLQTEYNQIRMKYDDLKKSKQDTLKE